MKFITEKGKKRNEIIGDLKINILVEFVPI